MACAMVVKFNSVSLNHYHKKFIGLKDQINAWPEIILYYTVADNNYFIDKADIYLKRIVYEHEDAGLDESSKKQIINQ
jgi:hypothetical protein